MGLTAQYAIAQVAAFQNKVQAGIVLYATATVVPESASESQTLTFGGTITGGGWAMAFGGSAPVGVPFNVSAPQLQQILQNLPTIGQGNIVVTGGPAPSSPLVITFVGALAGSPQPLFQIGNAPLQGTNPSVTATHTTTGTSTPLHTIRQNLANRAMSNLSFFLPIFCLEVAQDATVQTDWPGSPPALGVSDSQGDTDINAAIGAAWTKLAILFGQ